MKRVSELRELLKKHVPSAFIDCPATESGSFGDYPSIQLWDPDSSEDSIAPIGKGVVKGSVS